MATVDEETQRAARAKLAGALVVALLVLFAVLAGLIWASRQTAEPAAPEGGGAGTVPGAAASPDVAGAPAAGGWDTAGLTALAVRPMPQFPDSAALPQTLAVAGLPAIDVPAPTRSNRAGVGEGLPPTPQGAIGQLAALGVAGLRDLNPQTYNGAYASIALPGAPDPGVSPLGLQVAKNYGELVGTGSAGLPITSRWQLAGAQVKGVTDGGRSVVVCVAGELQAAQVNAVEVGTGDCQAMRFTGTDWRIAPVPSAAQAPITWPGSDAFVRAGFHPTDGGPQ